MATDNKLFFLNHGDYWPQTMEGRILTVVLSLYAIAIFGYITATLANVLIEKRKSLVLK